MKILVRPNLLRKKLRQNRIALGPNLQIPSPDLVEMIGLAGYDFVLLDGEHGAAFSRLPELLLAADAAGITSLVRVPSHDRGFLLPPLELGAGGLQVPFVNTAAQARAIVQETKFPPLGIRGVSTVTRAAKFGFVDRAQFRRDSNRETLLILQLETREAVENAEEIAAVPGVDMVFLGPADLAQSYGHAADRITPPTIKIMEQVIRRVLPINRVGISAFESRDVARWHRSGVSCFLTSSATPLRTALSQWRENLISGFPRSHAICGAH